MGKAPRAWDPNGVSHEEVMGREGYCGACVKRSSRKQHWNAGAATKELGKHGGKTNGKVHLIRKENRKPEIKNGGVSKKAVKAAEGSTGNLVGWG